MTSKLIHTYTEPETKGFWRIVFWFITGFMLLLGLSMVVVPFLILLEYQTWWVLFTIPFFIAGIFLNGSLLRLWKTTLWKQRHRASYDLYENRIETLEWPQPSKSVPQERTIHFENIVSVVASYYIVREILPQGLINDGSIENAPMFYIIYTTEEGKQIQNVLFPNHGDEGINLWFRHFTENQIPLLYNARQMFRTDTPILSDEKRLEYLLSTDENVAFPFQTSWLKDEPSALAAWQKIETQKQERAEAKDPVLKEARQKHSFRKWIISIVLPLQLMGILMFMVTQLGQSYNVQSANVLPGIAIFLLGGFLFFFLLKNHLRWHYMLIYYAMVLFLGFVSFIAAETEGALALGIGSASLLFPAVIWIPYLAIKKMPQPAPGSKPKDAAW